MRDLYGVLFAIFNLHLCIMYNFWVCGCQSYSHSSMDIHIFIPVSKAFLFTDFFSNQRQSKQTNHIELYYSGFWVGLSWRFILFQVESSLPDRQRYYSSWGISPLNIRVEQLHRWRGPAYDWGKLHLEQSQH